MSLHVRIVSRSTEIFSGEASYVSAPSASGEVGILAGRQPFLATMKAGKVRVTPIGEVRTGSRSSDQAQQTSREIEVAPGFISVDNDQVMIVVDSF